jgi:hypothetical protein
VVPELVFEVRSQATAGRRSLPKWEYLNAGVAAVCVLDSQTATTGLPCRRVAAVLAADDDLALPELLGKDFQVPVRRFFD